jgi:hypothetical protein
MSSESPDPVVLVNRLLDRALLLRHTLAGSLTAAQAGEARAELTKLQHAVSHWQQEQAERPVPRAAVAERLAHVQRVVAACALILEGGACQPPSST